MTCMISDRWRKGKPMGKDVNRVARAMALAVATSALCLTLASCGGAPQPGGGETAADGASKTMASDQAFTWADDADCSLCHAAQSSSLTDSTCQIAANHAGLECVQCHADDDELVAVHDGLALAETKGAKKLSRTEVNEDACVACHADAGTSEAAVNSVALTDDRGTIVNPHDLPESESHDTLTCGSCHAMHDKKPLEETASEACAQCHHQDVYECYTCHE